MAEALALTAKASLTHPAEGVAANWVPVQTAITVLPAVVLQAHRALLAPISVVPPHQKGKRKKKCAHV
jgi:hypothetical protein